MRDIGVCVEKLDAGSGKEHPRTDQRGGVAEHPVKLRAARQDRRAAHEEDHPEDRHTKRVGDPEDEAERGGDDAARQQDVDDDREHRLTRSADDLVGLAAVQDALGDELFGLDDMGHGATRI